MRVLRRKSVADLTVAELRRAILNGTLPPGSRLKPEELAVKMGVSRMPIRHALTVLEREGLVRTDRWRGSTVTPLDATQISQIYELRGILERAVAASAAQNRLDTGPLRSLIAPGRQAALDGDVATALDLDARFHTVLYQAFGNDVLSEVMVGLWGHVRRAIQAAVLSVAYRQLAWDEHEAIIEAIDAADPVRAATVAGDHMTSAYHAAIRNIEGLTRDRSTRTFLERPAAESSPA